MAVCCESGDANKNVSTTLDSCGRLYFYRAIRSFVGLCEQECGVAAIPDGLQQAVARALAGRPSHRAMSGPESKQCVIQALERMGDEPTA